MEQVILDHSYSGFRPAETQNKDKLDDSTQLISLFGKFPNFIKNENNVFSNLSRYEEVFRPFKNLRYYRINIKKKMEGFEIAHYLNGKLFSKGKYQNGEKTGIWREWWSDGKKMTKSEYRDGKEIGFWKSWWDDGNMKYEGEYCDGERTGTWINYDMYGKPMIISEFQDERKYCLITFPQ